MLLLLLLPKSLCEAAVLSPVILILTHSLPFPFSPSLLCHARFHLLLNTSRLSCVLLPCSFSSRFIRVKAAARPIEMAKMGSRRLFFV
jgi:hypothetical protein